MECRGAKDFSSGADVDGVDGVRGVHVDGIDGVHGVRVFICTGGGDCVAGAACFVGACAARSFRISSMVALDI